VSPIVVSANSARIEGYGADIAPFQVLDGAFKRDNGFEADIGVRQVTRAQCPAITFLSRLRNQRAAAPHLQIRETSLRGGDALTGDIKGYGDGSVQLVLVSDEGSAQDLSSLLKPAPDGKMFNLRMQRTGAPGAQPQLLIAIASPRPLEVLRGARSTPADQLFPLVLVEAQRTGQTIGASAQYFKLE
jgi:serine/threonine-protein kinase